MEVSETFRHESAVEENAAKRLTARIFWPYLYRTSKLIANIHIHACIGGLVMPLFQLLAMQTQKRTAFILFLQHPAFMMSRIAAPLPCESPWGLRLCTSLLLVAHQKASPALA